MPRMLPDWSGAESLLSQSPTAFEASEIALVAPGRKSPFAETFAGDHTKLSGIDVLETVVAVQGYLPPAACYPFRRRRTLGWGFAP